MLSIFRRIAQRPVRPLFQGASYDSIKYPTEEQFYSIDLSEYTPFMPKPITTLMVRGYSTQPENDNDISLFPIVCASYGGALVMGITSGIIFGDLFNKLGTALLTVTVAWPVIYISMWGILCVGSFFGLISRGLKYGRDLNSRNPKTKYPY